MLPKAQKLEEWNESFLTANKDSVAHVQAALSARHILNPDSKAECEKDLLATLDSPKITIDEAAAGIDLLNKWGSETSGYVQEANKKWPETSVFQLN
jgi:peptide alpha-N-acetyltransferase